MSRRPTFPTYDQAPISYDQKPVTYDRLAVKIRARYGSSFELGKGLQWQAGYGIVTFGTKDLKWVVDYVHNQREHHSKGTFFDRLERFKQSSGEEWDFSP